MAAVTGAAVTGAAVPTRGAAPADSGTRARRRRTRDRLRAAVPVVAGILVLAATAAVVGVGPFLEGIASISPVAILLAVGLTAVATAAAAWRWRLVATGFGLQLAWRDAVTAYYRSQFLNTVIPGGVVGDVHRAYRHGRSEDRLGVAARAVAAERATGQLVQAALTVAVLLPLGFGSSLAPLAWTAGAIAALAAVVVAAAAATARGRRLLHREYRMLRPLLSRPLTLAGIVVASIVVVAAHAATFVVAGLAVGVDAGTRELAVVALLVLAAAAIPIGVGGWGPREAAGASAFALVGLGAGAGVAVSAAFGVLAMIAVAPGLVVFLRERFRPGGARGIIGRRSSA